MDNDLTHLKSTWLYQQFLIQKDKTDVIRTMHTRIVNKNWWIRLWTFLKLDQNESSNLMQFNYLKKNMKFYK